MISFFSPQRDLFLYYKFNPFSSRKKAAPFIPIGPRKNLTPSLLVSDSISEKFCGRNPGGNGKED
jgi:hypothetical protein